METDVASREVAFGRLGFKFRAFLSYSHSDKKLAEKLQKQLETFPIDKALWGVPTPAGPIPPTLHPIFRDEEDAAAGASLSRELQRALEQSQFLVVICSPAAAKSDYVNEEIRHFVRKGGGDRILAFIVDGIPRDPVRNCFPRELLQRKPARGKSGASKSEPLAADIRDGWDAACHKLVSGLLGLPLDVILQRQRDRERRLRRWRISGAATLAAAALLVALGVHQLWRSHETRRVLVEKTVQGTGQLAKRTVQLSDGLGVSASAAVEVLKGIEDVFGNYSAHGAGDPAIGAQRASMLLDFARHYGKLRQLKEQERLIEQASAEIEKLRGNGKLEKATLTLHAKTHWLRGDMLLGFGKSEAALKEFEDGLKSIGEWDRRFFLEKTTRLDAEQYVPRARLILGKAAALVRLNRSDEPLANKRKALEEATRTIDMGRSLHLNNRKEGDREASEVMVDARYLAADLIRQLNDRKQESVAEAHVEEGLASAQRLRQLEPKRASAIGRVATLYLARGDFRRWQGDSLRALADYKESRNVSNVLHDSDPTDLNLKFAFGLMLVKVGEEITAQRERSQAKKAIEELKLAERLFTELRDEKLDDGRFRYWLWTAIQGLGYAYRLAGDFPNEMECHHRKLIIARDQSSDGPSARYVLAESLRDYGNALVVRDNPRGGIGKLEEARQLLAPAIAHPKPDWRVLRMQASIHEGLAVAAQAGRHFSDARDLAEAAYNLRERDRINAGRLDPHGKADLAENRRLAGTIQLANAQCADARQLYGQAVEILDRLVSEHERPNPEWRERYAVARQGLTEIHWKDGGPDCNDGPVDGKLGEMIVMARQLVR